jgi:hypothetical protein
MRVVHRGPDRYGLNTRTAAVCDLSGVMGPAVWLHTRSFTVSAAET